MLMIDNEAPKRRQDLRPCEVDGDKAYFHGWITEDDGVLKIPLLAKHIDPEKAVRRFHRHLVMCSPGCDLTLLRKTWALIEYANGEVAKVDPESVRFVD